MDIDLDRYRISPGDAADLTHRASDDDGGWNRGDAEDRLKDNLERLEELQEILYAQQKFALLVVFQAMDTGGKDSTIRKVFGPLNPQGVRVWNFRAPSAIERNHDYLWRVHHRAPARGYIGVFNRSHYEDVLIVRVKNLVEESVWSKRYGHINDFERLLTNEGTTVIKFHLHISKDYQKQRLQRRLDRPDKHWKFNPDDLTERDRWHDYQAAYEEALTRCSTEHAPWYVIPAEHRWYRNLLISRAVTETLDALPLAYPGPTFDPSKISIDDG